MYGHEGSSTTCSFSPGGDFFTSSGADAIVNVWKSNLNELDTEVLDETSGLQKMRSQGGAAAARTNSARGAARPAQRTGAVGQRPGSARARAGAGSAQKIQNESVQQQDVLAG